MTEDSHFYLDNAPPKEVIPVLRVLSAEIALTPTEIAESVRRAYGVSPQRDHTYSPRRLHDLGLATQSRRAGRLVYLLTPTGGKLQTLLGVDGDLAIELLHYLHFTGFFARRSDGLPPRKYLWSYRRCCELTWDAGYYIPPADLAATIQSEMRERFPHLDFTARTGTRFDATGAGRVYAWLRALQPAPLVPRKGGYELYPRALARPELALLALDDLYRARGYRYGDPVLIDDGTLHQLAGVFLLDPACARELLHTATRISDAATMRATLSGLSVRLNRAYGVLDL